MGRDSGRGTKPHTPFHPSARGRRIKEYKGEEVCEAQGRGYVTILAVDQALVRRSESRFRPILGVFYTWMHGWILCLGFKVLGPVSRVWGLGSCVWPRVYCLGSIVLGSIVSGLVSRPIGSSDRI